MLIIYKNKHGTIRMNGGGRDNAWRIYDISGIGFPKKTFTYNTYAGVYGQELNAVSITSRTITISGDISEKSQRFLPVSSIMKILNEDGELQIQTGRKIRRAKVRTISFDIDERKTMYKKFVLQLESDNPFFYGHTQKKFSVFSRSSLLSSPFVFPTSFSKRNMFCNANNGGDMETEPVFVLSKPKESAVVEGDNVVITNRTTGTSVLLEHTMQPGEEITINIQERTIVSSLSGNIINKISLDTILSDFLLVPGNNTISCDSSDVTLSVFCNFEELYLEASHDE